MNKNDAIKKYEKLTYDLAKSVSKISDIYGRIKFINNQMGWDGMIECDLSEALEKLAVVQAAMVTYSMEDKFRESDIKDMESSMKDVGLDSSMLHRSLNSGFSGGEKKKNEVLQLKFLQPKFIILDELDSGLDVDSLRIACENINNYIKENPETSVLIITHYPRILEYIKPDYVHILMDGKIQKTGDYSLAEQIEKDGYKMIGIDA